jgi:hypothetical protein
MVPIYTRQRGRYVQDNWLSGQLPQWRNQMMKKFRLLCLMIAISWGAAIVLTTGVMAAGSGQSMYQGIDQAPVNNIQANQGSNQMMQNPNQGSGPGGNTNPGQGNSQNTAGPGQGNRPGGFGNTTASGDRPNHAMDAGNMTAPPDKPDGNFDNSTAMSGMTGQRSGFENETAPSMPPDWNTDNSTAMGNMTRHQGFGNGTAPSIPPDWNADNSTAMGDMNGHGAGNTTMPAPPQQGDAANQGQQQTTNQQKNTNQQQSTNDLIAELLSWLKAHTG